MFLLGWFFKKPGEWLILGIWLAQSSSTVARKIAWNWDVRLQKRLKISAAVNSKSGCPKSQVSLRTWNLLDMAIKNPGDTNCYHFTSPSLVLNRSSSLHSNALHDMSTSFPASSPGHPFQSLSNLRFTSFTALPERR